MRVLKGKLWDPWQADKVLALEELIGELQALQPWVSGVWKVYAAMSQVVLSTI